jgi:L-alanine-DL-glutamate epimerase-like enolase superfamily enzyme
LSLAREAGRGEARAVATRIAAGENAAGLHDFCDMFGKGAIDIAQPSVTKVCLLDP